MAKGKLFIFSVLVLSISVGYTQVLRPEFQKEEYVEILKLIRKAHQPRDGKVPNGLNQELIKEMADSSFPEPKDYFFVYRSPTVAFDNGWDLWVNKNVPLAAIVIRGTIPTKTSFLANIYAAMVPAKGTLRLDSSFTFNYTLAENPEAAVHVGWLVASAFLSKTIIHQIDSCYKKGIKDFIITGHSQGGAISFLITAYLKHLQLENKLPQDIQLKTYCSASPKPGNLFFAYDFAKLTQNKWAYSIINTADWAPEMPLTIQTLHDFNNQNPFRHLKDMTKRLTFVKKNVIHLVYRQMDIPSKRAQKRYELYLGNLVSKAVKKQLPGFEKPTYFNSNYYVGAGNVILLHPDEDYYKKFATNDPVKDYWKHHSLGQYKYLVERE